MNEDTLIAISGYSGDAHQIETNLPIYLHHNAPVVVFSPDDAPITSISNPDVHCVWLGRKGWIGKHTLERQRLFLERLLTFPQNFFLFHDADSVALSPELPRYLYDRPDVLFSNEVPDTNPGPSLLPKLALQPPYFMSRQVVEGLVAAAKNPPTSYTGPSPDGWPMPIPTECIDHFMLQLAHGCNFRHSSFPDGVSWESISTVGLEEMARKVREDGAIFIHSVKSKSVLDRLMAERAEFIRSRR